MMKGVSGNSNRQSYVQVQGSALFKVEDKMLDRFQGCLDDAVCACYLCAPSGKQNEMFGVQVR